MSPLGTVLLAGGIGGAVYLYFRSAARQAQAIAAASGGSGIPATGGGVSGLAGRLWEQWKGDPLGIQNAKAVASTVKQVGTTAASQIAGGASDVVGFVKGIF